MKAIEVVTLLANKDTKFFTALRNYCNQEEVLGISVIMKTDYSRSILLMDANGESVIDAKKTTKQSVQVLKVDNETFDKLIGSYYYNKNWMTEVETTDDADIFDESDDTPTLNTSETRQGSCKVEINQETGVISIYTNVI